MGPLLAIIATEQDYPILCRHWQYFRMTGWPILGCGTEDGRTQWPEPVMRMDTGKVGVIQTPAGSSIFGLVEQEIDIWRFLLQHEEFSSVCVVEADNLFTRKPQEHPGGIYLVTLLPNCAGDVFRTPEYFSTPRWSDREIAWLLYIHGTAMFRQGDVEHYISDRFPAWVCYQHGIPFANTPNWSPSVQVANDTEWIRDARSAIRNGAWCLHSVKHQWQLDALRPMLPCP